MGDDKTVAEAIIREYLTKHELHATLQAFDAEAPRTRTSITNRNTLRKCVGVEEIAAKLKRRNQGEPSLPVLHLLIIQACERENKADQKSTERKMRPHAKGTEKPEISSTRHQDSAHSTISNVSTMSNVPVLSNPNVSSVLSTSVPDMKKLSMLDEDISEPFGSAALRQPPPSRAAAPPADDLMVMEDFDDDLDSPPAGSAWGPASSIISRGATSRVASGASPLSPDVARQIKAKLFGTLGPPDSWKQGFFYSMQTRGLEYGLVQKQGGPCGILAAVQAHVLCALTVEGQAPKVERLTSAKLADALTDGLADSLWQAGGGKGTKILSCRGGTTNLSLDEMTFQAVVLTADSLQGTKDLVQDNLTSFMEEFGWGLMLFTYSLILTHGLSLIEREQDDASTTLMGAHGYCTQDLVNLIITGKAVTNVFNNRMKLDEHTVLNGITDQSKIGFLTLFEWYKYIEVGSNYKKPKFPVWVICCESHFSCLFSESSAAMTNQLPFDLQYYDGLALQEEVIRLTISWDETGGHTAKAGNTVGSRANSEGDLIPPMEFVIETRWPGVKVDWNGSEKLL